MIFNFKNSCRSLSLNPRQDKFKDQLKFYKIIYTQLNHSFHFDTRNFTTGGGGVLVHFFSRKGGTYGGKFI